MFKKLINNLINNLILFSNKSWHKVIFKYFSYLSILFILFTFTGLIAINSEYVHIVHMFILYYVCIILLIRFNPFVKESHVKGDYQFDRNIAFTAGIILLTTTVAKQIVPYISKMYI
jgi:hypothetical protein